MEVTQHTKNKYKIDYLQASPEFGYFVPNRKMQHIGKAMLDGLKSVLPNKQLFLDSVLSAVRFYEKQGFKLVDDVMTMVFKP